MEILHALAFGVSALQQHGVVTSEQCNRLPFGLT